MVRLRRGPPPSGLLKTVWTRRWVAINAGTQRGDWATPTAKKRLSVELRSLTHGKCAFCESVLGVTSYLEIEHYVAKTVRPNLAFNWENLFPICRLCNNAKSDTDHAGALLKPDVDDPERKFWLNPDSGKLEPHPSVDPAELPRIELTIELCNLQRGPLCTKRIETMETAIHWLERLARAENADDLLQAEWDHMTAPTTEYKFVIRHVLETHGAPELAAVDRAKFEAR